MRIWMRAVPAALMVLWLLGLNAALAMDLERAHLIGRRVSAIALPEAQSGEPWKLAANSQEAAAVVLYFLSTECPVTNRYLPTLNKLQAKLQGRLVTFIGVNSNVHDTPEEVKRHAAEFDITFPVILDTDGHLARQLGVSRTSEAILLDDQLKVRFRGEIDNRFQRGVTRPRATHTYLEDAIESVLQGRRVDVEITDVGACPLNLAPSTASDQERAPVTYTNQVASIIESRCQSCHRSGGIGPFELETFEDAESWSASIREVVTEGLMPPWHADAPQGIFSNDRSLTSDEYQTLLDWIDSGCAEGRVVPATAKSRTHPQWTIGAPDLVLKMGKTLQIPAATPEGGIPYKYVWADHVFERDSWVTAAEFHPGATEVVHHSIVYIVPPNVKVRLKNDELQTSFLDDLLGNSVVEQQSVIGFVPGDNARIFRKGLARRIPQGSRLLFEMHYTPNGKKAADQSEIGIIFSPAAPQHEVLGDGAINFWFTIPAETSAHSVRATYHIERDITLLAMNPHMHYRGKSFRYELVNPSGERSTLLNVPRYNFEWQTSYILSQPLDIAQGSRIECTAVYDNSVDNPWNPDPTTRVSWGDQSWEEMMIGYIEFYER